MKVEFYNCRIRLGGGEHEMHDVPKYGVSRQEVMLYADIHGNEQIVDIVPIGIGEVDEADFNARISSNFGPARVERVLGIKLNTIESQMIQSPPLVIPSATETNATHAAAQANEAPPAKQEKKAAKTKPAEQPAEAGQQPAADAPIEAMA